MEDFPDPKSLGDYINFLDKNETEYFKYLEWRSYYKKVCKVQKANFCNLCHQIQHSKLEPKIISDFAKFWHNSSCEELKTESAKQNLLLRMKNTRANAPFNKDVWFPELKSNTSQYSKNKLNKIQK